MGKRTKRRAEWIATTLKGMRVRKRTSRFLQRCGLRSEGYPIPSERSLHLRKYRDDDS